MATQRPTTFEHIHDSSFRVHLLLRISKRTGNQQEWRFQASCPFWHLRRTLSEGFKPSCSVAWEQAWRKYVQGLALLSVWLAGSIWKGREDKRLLTCRAHSPDLDNLNTMWLDARHVWFMMSSRYPGAPALPG